MSTPLKITSARVNARLTGLETIVGPMSILDIVIHYVTVIALDQAQQIAFSAFPILTMTETIHVYVISSGRVMTVVYGNIWSLVIPSVISKMAVPDHQQKTAFLVMIILKEISMVTANARMGIMATIVTPTPDLAIQCAGIISMMLVTITQLIAMALLRVIASRALSMRMLMKTLTAAVSVKSSGKAPHVRYTLHHAILFV